MDDVKDEAESPGRAEQILEGLHRASYGWALLCCNWDRDLAQDVLQTAYLRILDGSAALDGRPDPRPWVFGVIRRTALEEKRRALARLFNNRLWIRNRPAPDPPESPERLSAAHQERRRLRMFLERLSTRQRSLLHLVFYEDMTIEEASAVMGVSVGTGRRHYERGKARLKKLLLQQQVIPNGRRR